MDHLGFGCCLPWWHHWLQWDIIPPNNCKSGPLLHFLRQDSSRAKRDPWIAFLNPIIFGGERLVLVQGRPQIQVFRDKIRWNFVMIIKTGFWHLFWVFSVASHLLSGSDSFPNLACYIFGHKVAYCVLKILCYKLFDSAHISTTPW